MMRLAKKEDMSAVMALWQETFEDTSAEIADYFVTCGSKARVCIWEEDSEIRAQLILLPVIILCKTKYEAEYIYALAVKQEFRKTGIATKLLREVQKLLTEEKKAGILVPAEESLIGFYEKRGFVKCFPEEKYRLTFPSKRNMTTDMTQMSTDCNSACFKEIDAVMYQELRQGAFCDTGHVDISLQVLSYVVDNLCKAGGKCVEISWNGKKYGVLYRQSKDSKGRTVLEVLEVTAPDAEEAKTVSAQLSGFVQREGREEAVLRRSYLTMGVNLQGQLSEALKTEKVIFNLVMD